MATVLAWTAGEALLTCVGQAIFLKGITETASTIYDTFKDRFFANCPELIRFIEEFDLEFKINTIQQFFNEISIDRESDAINSNLMDIYQVILLFKLELKKIKVILVNHEKKFFHKLRKPNYKRELERLKMYSNLFDRRLSLFKTLIKTFSSDIVKMKEKKEINKKFDGMILDEDEYDLVESDVSDGSDYYEA